MSKPAHNEYLFIELLKEGYFRIDNEGRIWRLAIRSRWKDFIKSSERELKYVSSKGYIHIWFYKNKKKYCCKAHRIVWIYFNGEIPDGLEINHKNGIKTDNRPENLELVTISENKKHAYRIGLECHKGEIAGEKHPLTKLNDDDIKNIRLRYSSGETLKMIAKDFNISIPHTHKIIKRKRWAHI